MNKRTFIVQIYHSERVQQHQLSPAKSFNDKSFLNFSPHLYQRTVLKKYPKFTLTNLHVEMLAKLYNKFNKSHNDDKLGI
ncbi:hypothetical protein T12_876 [Trichinella patagoniensis]|uniref:Uncharacterized protein n=1 Tax=Trichinella patagoniensis TaxID=990121 RepID=A0A0V0ZQN1_9BILA|nr:hypothetical protein T12_876 [Trichinella patagoniensis]